VCAGERVARPAAEADSGYVRLMEHGDVEPHDGSIMAVVGSDGKDVACGRR